MLEKSDLVELQKIICDEYGQNLNLAEVDKIGSKLINLYESILLNKNQNYEMPKKQS